MTRQGLVLGLVIITSVVMTIAAYTALFVALSIARMTTPLDERRIRARFASEAGVAWATERLYENTGGILDRAGPVEFTPPKTLTGGRSVTVRITRTGTGYAIESSTAL